MAAIPHQAHRGEWDATQEEGGLRVPHPCWREVICERGKVNWGAAADGRREVNDQLWRARLRLPCTGGAEPREQAPPYLGRKRAATRTVVSTVANQGVTRLLQCRGNSEALRRAYRGTQRCLTPIIVRHKCRSPRLFTESPSDQTDKPNRPRATHRDEAISEKGTSLIAFRSRYESEECSRLVNRNLRQLFSFEVDPL